MIRMKGLMKAPLTNKFTFFIESDAAVQLKINGEIVLDHFVGDRNKGEEGQEWGAHLKSKPVSMTSGSMYEFEIRYWRNDSKYYKPNPQSFMIVKWESEDLPF